jgi:hypothetical protein
MHTISTLVQQAIRWPETIEFIHLRGLISKTAAWIEVHRWTGWKRL